MFSLQKEFMDVGVCVQIGIHDFPDYLYLTGTVNNRDPLKNIPVGIKYTSWDYYGVDCDPSSIHKMLENYGHMKNTKWIIAYVDHTDSELVETYSWFFSTYEKLIKFYVPSITLNMLLDSLNINRIDVLAMDIEGSENNIFRNYDWSIKPRYIAVESHHDKHDELIQIIESNGYKIVLNEPTNKNDTKELQFMRI